MSPWLEVMGSDFRAGDRIRIAGWRTVASVHHASPVNRDWITKIQFTDKSFRCFDKGYSYEIEREAES